VDPAPAPTGAIQRGAGQHILVVDDEPSLVRVATAFLQRLGYRTTGVKSAAEALYIIRRHRGHFDLVITDLTMPIMNGLRLAKDLHALRPSLPVILVSGFDGEKAAEAGRAPNIRCVLQKPFVIETLARTIADIFAGQPAPEAPPGKTA
jgi:CheY-like chemotaxis protein